jgi:hypothetical protein
MKSIIIPVAIMAEIKIPKPTPVSKIPPITLQELSSAEKIKRIQVLI